MNERNDLLGDILIIVSEALGELESQDVDLHKKHVGGARQRNKAAQERLGVALQMLDNPTAASGSAPAGLAVRSYVTWMGRAHAAEPYDPLDGMWVEELYDSRGRRQDWPPDQWPPVKVRVTVIGA